MLKKATENNREEIMNYCLAEPNINLFIIGDMENFGFDAEFQDVWIQSMDEKLVGVVLRYHDNFIIYSRDLDIEVKEVTELLSAKDAKVISGKLSVIELFYPLIKAEYTRREMYFCELKNTSKLEESIESIIIATTDDAMDIAVVYGQISEFEGMYSSEVEERYKQINSRIKTKEGIHMFMKEDGEIITHGNTTAETTVSGMIGGIFTIPEYRNQGFASKMVSALSRSLSFRGKSACLFFDNPEAGKIYYRLGFKDIGKWVILGRK